MHYAALKPHLDELKPYSQKFDRWVSYLVQLVHMMFNGFSETSITIERLPVYYKQVRSQHCSRF